MLSLTELLILGLASYRATQLVVWDTIGEGPRARLELWHAHKHTSWFRTFLRQLVSCTYCAGWWLSMAATLTYLTAISAWGNSPLIVHAVECWAVTGVQALLNRYDDSRSNRQSESN